jgi:hypothetical protein
MWGRCEEVRILLDNAEPQIGSRRGLEHPRSFQFHLLIADRLEKSKTFTKEDRDDAHMDFVNQSVNFLKRVFHLTASSM